MNLKNILLLNTEDKKHNISVYFQNGTFWLTQKTMAELFGVNVPAVRMFLIQRNCTRIQLFPFWKQLLPMAKITTRNFNASKPS